MSSYDYQTPDLASILRTLSGQNTNNLPPAVGTYAPAPQYSVAHRNTFEDPGTSYTPEQYQAPYPPPASSTHQFLPVSRAAQPEPRVKPEPNSNLKSNVDPKTITSWPPALRYITKKVTQKEEFAAQIRKLIKSQHDHEKQWAKGREELIEGRRKREQGRNAINDVLRAVGGVVDTAPETFDVEDEATALAKYDKKVYVACMEMVKSITNELSALVIPFFAINRSLINDSPDCQGIGDVSIEGGKETSTVPLTSATLQGLQKRMLELLEDLCKE